MVSPSRVQETGSGTVLAESVARPGGNVTGLQVMQTELAGKHLSLLKEALPGLSRVGILAADVGLSEAQLQANPRGATWSWISA